MPRPDFVAFVEVVVVVVPPWLPAEVEACVEVADVLSATFVAPLVTAPVSPDWTDIKPLLAATVDVATAWISVLLSADVAVLLGGGGTLVTLVVETSLPTLPVLAETVAVLAAEVSSVELLPPPQPAIRAPTVTAIAGARTE